MEMLALAAALDEIEAERKSATPRADDPGFADRAAAIQALCEVTTFLRGQGIETSPLDRLIFALLDVALHGRQEVMLCAPRPSHRPASEMREEGTKGALAGVMEVMQRRGLSRKAAADWVVKSSPKELQARLGLTARKVQLWHERFGGAHGDAGPGRDFYRMVVSRRALDDREARELMQRLTSEIPLNPRS